MSLISRAIATVSHTLRRRANAGALYAPGGTIGNWAGIFTLGSIANRVNGQVPLSPDEQLTNNFGVVSVAVGRIAEDISSLRVTVEVAKRGGKWVPDPTHPLQHLLDQPVPWSDGIELRYLLMQHLCLCGHAYLLVVDGSHGEPRELHVLYPNRVDIIPDPVQFVGQYRYRTLNGQMSYFAPFTSKAHPSGLGVMELKIPEPSDPYSSNSAVQAGSNSITLDSEIRAYGRFYFANNATPGVVLESDQPHPGVEASRAQRESWNEQYQGAYNAGKVATLWGGLKLKSLAPAFKDLQFPEITKATRQDILMHFGVPGPVVGYTDTGALGADVFRGAKMVYQSQTLDPHRKRLERALNRLAARWPGCRVVIESPVEEDLAALEARQQKEYENGAISRNEYRAARQYEDDGQPDVWLVPGTAHVFHGLTPEDTALTPNPGEPSATPELPPPETVTDRAARYRQMWSDEYRLLRDATDPATAAATAHARWLAEGEAVAAHAASFRAAALSAAQHRLPLAYEALKAEARTLAGVPYDDV